MSLLVAALAALATRHNIHAVSSEASQSDDSTLSSLSNSASASSSDIFSLTVPHSSKPLHLPFEPARANEHLAVLLPKHLWKADSLASCCDNFYCRIKFSLFERRHHCRKCGGVYCARCTARTTLLLDASNLSFLHPPRNVPLAAYESPISPILPGRVCDDCWEQVHGCPTPRTPDLVHSASIPVLNKSVSSGSSSLSSSVSTPPNGHSPISRRTLRTVSSVSSLNSGSRRLRPGCVVLPETVIEIEALESQPSYGEFGAYPLSRSSAICKAMGGGRWEPKPSVPQPGYRIPGGKAPFELDMEREEEEARRRRSNPVVRDGEFQYRFFREPEPVSMARSPFQLSTF